MVTLETRMAQIGVIKVERDELGIMIVSDDITLCYGVAPTFVEAVGDYYTTLKEWQLFMGEDEHE